MFALSQIQDAHSKVKSGADFPKYIAEIKTFGVAYYETYVSDGHTNYFGEANIEETKIEERKFKISSNPKFEANEINIICNSEQFKIDLKEHQQGKTDFMTFISNCANFGINKWAVCLDKMTCTYFDKNDNEILVEIIPH
jgi:uncharacterized protein YbcV (DUF1398 family)